MNAHLNPSQPGRCSDPAEVAAIAAQYGLVPLDEAGISAARGLATRLVPGEIASAATFQMVQQKSGGGVFGFFEESEITALLASFPVNEAGAAQLATGSYDALTVDIATIAAPGEIPGAYYGWGFAASTKEGGRAVVKASAQIHRDLFWATPTYARAVTADGLRALSSIGFVRANENDASLLWIKPSSTPPSP